MYPFVYKNPVKIIFGENSIRKIGSEIPATARVLMLYGGGSIKSNGIYRQVVDALSKHSLYEFGGIEANPDYDTLMKAVELVKQEKIDFLLAVGGGSVLDGTKFIAAASTFSGNNPWDILENNAPVTTAIPLGSILTLPATGSEMNSFAVISRRSIKQKLAFGSPLVYPIFSVLDPMVMKSLPKKQRANGVVDAYIHVLEQYLTFPNQAAIQDGWAEGILRTLHSYGQRYVNEPFNYDVASNIMWAATSALNGIIGVGVPHDWATHGIGHEITALFGLDHGETLAIVMPGMMRVMLSEKEDKLKQYAQNVLQIPAHQFNIDLTIDGMESFFHVLGVKTRLSDYQIGSNHIPHIIENLSKGSDIKLGEKGKVTREKVQAILEDRV